LATKQPRPLVQTSCGEHHLE